MSKKKKIIISLFSLALCVALSFAWINELQNPSGRVMSLKLMNSHIGDSDVNITLSVLKDDSDEFLPITNYYDDEIDDGVLYPFENFAPGCRKKFRLDITNTSDVPVRLRMILTDIICENQELQENIIIGTNGFKGFNSAYPAPNVENLRLVDGIDDSGGFTLVDNVQIPPHGENECVSIYFYVMFSAAGSENLEGLAFSIGTINFLTL